MDDAFMCWYIHTTNEHSAVCVQLNIAFGCNLEN